MSSMVIFMIYEQVEIILSSSSMFLGPTLFNCMPMGGPNISACDAVVMGKPNMTSISFWHCWAKEQFLPNCVLEPDTLVETACKWLHELGFNVLDKKKGVWLYSREGWLSTTHRGRQKRKKVKNPSIRKARWQLLEYGKGYCNWEKFMKQV